MNRFRKNSLAVMVSAALLAPAQAQFRQQGDKLVGSGTSGPFVGFGRAAALSDDGNTSLVGGPSDNNGQGAAWAFQRSNGNWIQSGPKLTAVDVAGSAFQGSSVALSADGSTAAIGGYGDNGGAGAAWVFTRTGGAWIQQGFKLVGSGAAGAAWQGWSVALSSDGNTALVGGENDNGNVGAAWVFTRGGGVWTQQGSKLAGYDSAGASLQGSSVALSSDGNTAAVGGCGDNGVLGAVWIFARNGGAWSQQGPKLSGNGATGAACEGVSIALSGDGNTVLVGGSSDNAFAGAAWVFTRSGGLWSQQGAKLAGAGAVGAASQGISVALSRDGNEALIGGWQDDSSTGAAWIFTRSGGGWIQQGSKLLAAGASGRASLGYSAALSGDGATALIGGSWDNNFQGAAWVFVAGSGLTVSLSHAGSFTPGQSGATFSIVVGNQVNGGATNGLVMVTENPPPGLTVTGMAGFGWSCSSISCVRNDSLNGGTAYPPINVTVSVSPGAPASLTNQVTVTNGAASVSAADAVGVNQVAITLAHAGSFLQGSGGNAYSITVTNSGGSPVTGLTVTETLPPGLSLTSMSGAGWSCSGAACTQTAALGAGASTQIAALVSVAANAPALVTNQVSLSGSGLSQPMVAVDRTAIAALSSATFVRQLYRDLLSREPDAGGMAYWQGLLDRGVLWRAQVAASFFTGAEFSDNGLYVVKVYLAALGRDPDFAGWFNWTAALRAGTNRLAVLNSVVGSPEFANRFGSGSSNASFVALVYQNVLGRAPDPSGLAFWVGLLNSGQLTQATLLDSFIRGAEFDQSSRARSYANLCYMGFLRRSADPSGLAVWTATLAAGVPLTAVIEGFVTGPEYLARLAQIAP